MERWSISPALDSRAPVITTLNLAGHSSTPLIEHLNLTRCYCWSQRFCQVLTNQWIVPDHHGTLLFSQLSHACCRQPESQTHLPVLWAPALHRKLKMSPKVTVLKSNNFTSTEAYITRDQLSCRAAQWRPFGEYSSHFAAVTLFPLTLFLSVTPGFSLRENTSWSYPDNSMFTITFNLSLSSLETNWL